LPEQNSKPRRKQRDESLTYPLFTEPSPIRSILPDLGRPPAAPLPATARQELAPGPAPASIAKPPVSQALDVTRIFQEEYRLLRPRAPMLPFHIRFRRFVSLNTTIRLREGELHVSLSDILESAPESVLHAIAHILIAKIYKKPIDPGHNNRYKRFQYSEPVARRTEQIRSTRGQKRILGPEGRYYHLEHIFDELNERFFQNLLGRPTLTWSEHHARRLLGHYDAAHNTIVVSKIFDRPSSPRYAIEYLLYHEMLHLKHPVSVRGTRRCVHSPAFRADEKRFPQLKEALAFLKRL
jgi:predicted metal-dependent hydrolase